VDMIATKLNMHQARNEIIVFRILVEFDTLNQ